MTMLTPNRFMQSIRKTPVLLDAVLCGVTQERALLARDGDDGWNAVEIVCHLRDFEEIFFERARRIVEEDRPVLKPYDHLALVTEREYSKQDLGEVYEALNKTRQSFIAWLETLDEAAWARTGVHPEAGDYTLLEQVVQVVTHDLDHLEQLARVLGLPCSGTEGGPLVTLPPTNGAPDGDWSMPY